jgi:hypothetical protein
VSGFGLLFEMAHKKHKIFKKSHTPDAHLPMDARIQERESERERERGPKFDHLRNYRKGSGQNLMTNAKPTAVNLLRQEERHGDTK